MRFFFVKAFLSCVFACAFSANWNIADDAFIPHLLDAASRTWVRKLDFSASFNVDYVESSEDLDGSRNILDTHGTGVFVLNGDAIRLAINWDKHGEIYFFRSFDFSSKQGVDVFEIKSGRIAKSKDGFVDQTNTQLVVNSVKIRPSNSELTRARFPIMEISNPIGFTAGWRDSVMFDGLSRKTIERHRLFLEIQGVSGEFASIFKNDANGIGIQFKDDFGNVTMTRKLLFRLVGGIPLKVGDHYQSVKSDGSPNLTKNIEILKFASLDGIPFPLEMKTSVTFRSKSSCMHFRFDKSSLRKSTVADFDQKFEDVRRLKKNSGVYDIVKSDVSRLKSELTKRDRTDNRRR